MNLNTSTQQQKPLERFNPVRPQGHGPSFRPTFRTFVSLLLATAAAVGIGAFACFGIMNGGNFVELRSLLVRKPNAAASVKDAKSQEAARQSTEEQMHAVFTNYRDSWNSGEMSTGRPQNLFRSYFDAVVDDAVAKGDDVGKNYNENTKIAAARLESFVVVSDSKAFAEATFYLQRTVTQRNWFNGEEIAPHPEKRIVVERFVRYCFTLEKEDEKWRIAKQTWLEKSPARLKTEEDSNAEPVPMPEASVLFTDIHPNKDQLQSRYEGMAASMNAGIFPTGEFYDTYKMILAGDTERTRDAAKDRLEKLRAKVDGLDIKIVVEGVSQSDRSSLCVLATYRVNLMPKGSKNVYTITWQDEDRWVRSTLGNWYIDATFRKNESSLGETYGF